MHRHRTAVRLALLTLLAGALVPMGAAPAVATPGCLDETLPPGPVPALPLSDGCDDSTPPETTLTASTTPNAAGFLAASTMTFTVGAQVSDGDTGPFGLECTLAGPGQAHDWRACTSPVTYAGLPDGSYAFRARAVDLGDTALDPDSPLAPGTVADTPDLDPTPARLTWTQDSAAPFVFVTSTAYDEQTPTQPVVTSGSMPIRINSSEPGSTFECRDNGRAIPCTGGRFELATPGAGRHRFTARSVDRAGNASAWSEPVEFYVPTDLRRQRGWRTVRGDGYFRGAALRATRRGARLVLPRATVGELRLLASTGRGFGTVRLRVGKRDWHVVSLAGRTAAMKEITVLDRYSGVRAGRIVIESLTDRPVVVDAVVARSNRFPSAQ
ncbi:hypothetical protein GCM10009641_35810 [Mycobacterium cookii]|uniref:Bacterial Ig-like domain-containing protein n=1 Tax=Nocardioides furvisabuli TaxID=375542 RepID=A0ABP5IPH5_9ACTN|nr:hypothetical protein [Nocardioides furvisabuli]